MLTDPSGTTGPQIQARNSDSNNFLLNENNKNSKISSKNKSAADKLANEVLSDENAPPPKIAPPVFLSAPPPPPPPPPNPAPMHVPRQQRQFRMQNGEGRGRGGVGGPSILRSQSMSTADRMGYVSGPPPKFRPPPPPIPVAPTNCHIPKVNIRYIYILMLDNL